MRSAIFIDGGYLLNQLADAQITPDYRRLAEHLLAPLRRQTTLDLMRCYFYYCPPWMSEKPTEGELRRMAAHEKFAEEIEANDRWQLRLGKLERRREGDKQVFAQKRVDVQLSVDLVHHAAAGHIQHAVVVAGDSDFIPAIAAAKESGATVTLWCDNDKSVHRDLMAEADEVHFIDWKTFPQLKAKPAEDSPARSRGRQPRDTQAAAGEPSGLQAVLSARGKRPEPPVADASELAVEAEGGDVPPAEAKKPGRRRRRGGRGRRGKGKANAAPAES